ncbi:MAG TPA: S41 family peptidase [Candidatus Obscuribacterales bacterium]
MKLYERGSLKRVLGLLAALLILVLFYMGRPEPLIIPAQTDPQTLYHTAWRVVGETFYDRGKLEDWQSWEHRYDGKLHSQQDAEKAIDEMLKSLDDPFTYFLGARATAAEIDQRRGSFVGIGITLGVKLDTQGQPVTDASGQVFPAVSADGYPLVKGVIEGGPAADAGLKAGDEIVAVFEVQSGKLVPLDTRAMTLATLTGKIRGPAGSSVQLIVRREGKAINLTIVRAAVQIRSLTYKRLEGNLGYIKIEHFGADNMVPQLVEAVRALKDARGLVVDLRNNPGGQVPNAIWGAAVFLERGHVTTMKSRESGRLVESQISLTPDKLVVVGLEGTESELMKARRDVRQQTKLPLVILVNEHSASASEMFAGALQDNGRAVVVGVKTFGKGIGQSLLPMPNGTTLHVTTLRYYTPKMRWVGDASGGLFSNGIIPDVVVPADKAADGDNQLRAAQERLETLISTGR